VRRKHRDISKRSENGKLITVDYQQTFLPSTRITHSTAITTISQKIGTTTMTVADEYFFGLALTTHRDHIKESYFLYEALIAGISIAFFRSTVHWKNEPPALSWFFALSLGFLALNKKPYSLILAVELFSCLVPLILTSNLTTWKTPLPDHILRLVLIAASGCFSMVIMHYAASGQLWDHLSLITPASVTNMLHTLIPIEEVLAAYNIMSKFQKKHILDQQLQHLLFVTAHIQYGIGYLGIAFLNKEQQRRNELVRMDTNAESDYDEKGNEKSDEINANNKKKKEGISKQEKAARFQRGAAPFILFAAVPYMIQIIFYGNINKFASTCLEHE